MATVAIVSFRLGHTDGVSIVAAHWQRSLEQLGFTAVTVAGEGGVDRTVPGLALGAPVPPTAGEVAAALADADLVVVENVLTIPMNLPASRVLAGVLRGRPAILHHHDPPWQRERFAHVTELPPDDPAWRHVTINELTRRQLAGRGIRATTVYNGFDVHEPPGDRAATRRALGVGEHEPLLLHPVRAIARKNVPGALALAEAVGGVYWLLGPAEEGYGPELARHLGAARCRVLRGLGDRPLADAYAACDAVLFPSTWEGFGNPPIEAAIHRRQAVVGTYPIAAEVLALGFRFLPDADPAPLAAWLAHPDPVLLDEHRRLAVRHFSLERVTANLELLLDEAGWLP
ncbi:MAG: glycosyltransferase family 4 protein [Acidimicrobiales bacterium]|nr:glycosyltransferase family 4 protein [Acidimicrobiales bacterium]